MGWAARRACLSSSLGPYLRGISTHRDKQWQMPWRLLLAKTQNNQAFEAEWQRGEHEMPSVEALSEACRALHLCDKALLGHFLGGRPQQIRPLACPQKRKRLFKKSRATRCCDRASCEIQQVTRGADSALAKFEGRCCTGIRDISTVMRPT